MSLVHSMNTAVSPFSRLRSMTAMSLLRPSSITRRRLDFHRPGRRMGVVLRHHMSTKQDQDTSPSSLIEAACMLRDGVTSSDALVKGSLARIEQASNLNAFTKVHDVEDVLPIASQRDADLQAASAASSLPPTGGRGGGDDGRSPFVNEDMPLCGIPIAIKDNFCTTDLPTTCASSILKDYVSPFDASVVARLRTAGAVVIGKTNMDEFSMGSGSAHSHFGPVLNPWSNERTGPRVPGGSSGGSAAAVASGLVLGAIGSDTGGSVRQPAAYCGIVGLKPSYGLASRYGLIAYASSLDTPGVLTRTVEDAALMLDVISGHDARESTSMKPPQSDVETGGSLKYLSAAREGASGVAGLRVGVPKEYSVMEMSESARALWTEGIRAMREAGADVIEVSLPHTRFALPAYYLLASAEAASNLARFDGVRYGSRENGGSIDAVYTNTRSQHFGDEVKRRILLGTFALSRNSFESYYVHAQRVRSLVIDDFSQVFAAADGGVDVLLTPTAPSPAYLQPDAHAGGATDVEEYLNDIMTIPASLAGLPSISVPVFAKDGDIGAVSGGGDDVSTAELPFGMQLIAARWQEKTLLRAANALSRHTSNRWPLPHRSPSRV
eukprot:TRINITY_DN6228_c0_g1_i1.p1 TRINITY_DN6228_c0_g1~~TRINITY_DN6228_c0_g1_i1.p1  ORF type:complete len:609 (+),score=102.51 TRINITY_DN6228_c0_g1_i1:257-2083(+)